MLSMLAVTSFNTSWPWYVIRASGISAVALLILIMVSGIGMVTGLTYRFIEPLKAWSIHRAMAIAMSLLAIIHVSFLLIDSFAKYNVLDVLIPFKVQFEQSQVFGINVGSFYNALGIFSLYMLPFIVLSSLFFIESKKKLWELLHYLSYPFMVLVYFHTLFLGTDFKHGVLRLLWIVFGLVLAVLTVTRLARLGSLKQTEIK
mgnify:FL=1